MFFSCRRFSLIAVLTALPAPIVAQADSATSRALVVHGVAVSRGTPVSGVNVFDIETLEGSVTDSLGRFEIPLRDRARTQVRIVAKAIGFTALDTVVALLPNSEGVTVVLQLSRHEALMPISVMAGRYTATAARTTTLTSTEVANTPGSNADISGAIKTLPGVQNVDEGTGLFVRGGDFTETRMFIDGAPLFSAYQFEAPTGSVAGTINPFLTGSIAFASGGFGAEWGNVLSGVVDLRTQGRPTRSFTNVNASILGATVSGGLALPHGLGGSVTAGVTNLHALMELNGNPRSFSPAPRGQTYSALGAWQYSRTGIAKVFALVQRNRFGIPVQDAPSINDFASDRTSDVIVASWTDTISRWRPFASMSTSGFEREESKGSYRQTSRTRAVQLRLNSAVVMSDRLSLNSGVEVERLHIDNRGIFPASQDNPNAPDETFASRLSAAANRAAFYLSLDTRPTSNTQLILGARANQSGFATDRIMDPRVSFAWMPISALTFTSSFGVYHQTADPAFLDRLQSRTPKLPELRAQMLIAGVQAGEGTRQFRLEGWSKTYSDLAALTRSYSTVANLSGRAFGSDVFARTPLPLGTTGRLTVSLSESRRDDPNTRQRALASFDVTGSATAIMQKEWKSGWSAGVAFKRATGRPYTDVQSASFDSTTRAFVPTYDAPNAKRLPTFSRTDLTVSRQIRIGVNNFAAVFAGINNLLNQTNVFSYTWSPDYAQRIPVRSTVSRTFFVGANLVMLASQ